MEGNRIECTSEDKDEICVGANQESIFTVIASPACQRRIYSLNKDLFSKDYMIKPIMIEVPNVMVSSQQNVYLPVNKTRTVTKYETVWQILMKQLS